MSHPARCRTSCRRNNCRLLASTPTRCPRQFHLWLRRRSDIPSSDSPSSSRCGPPRREFRVCRPARRTAPPSNRTVVHLARVEFVFNRRASLRLSFRVPLSQSLRTPSEHRGPRQSSDDQKPYRPASFCRTAPHRWMWPDIPVGAGIWNTCKCPNPPAERVTDFNVAGGAAARPAAQGRAVVKTLSPKPRRVRRRWPPDRWSRNW